MLDLAKLKSKTPPIGGNFKKVKRNRPTQEQLDTLKEFGYTKMPKTREKAAKWIKQEIQMAEEDRWIYNYMDYEDIN
jgi:hypothetical protein